MSLCSPSIQQCERQMYFYWADYPRAHCPAARDACASAPLKSVSTVAVRWVMFMRFSDFLPFGSAHSVLCTDGVVSLIPADDLCYIFFSSLCTSVTGMLQNASLKKEKCIIYNKIHKSNTVLPVFCLSKNQLKSTSNLSVSKPPRLPEFPQST